jgi:hypothetical protein
VDPRRIPFTSTCAPAGVDVITSSPATRATTGGGVSTGGAAAGSTGNVSTLGSLTGATLLASVGAAVGCADISEGAVVSAGAEGSQRATEYETIKVTATMIGIVTGVRRLGLAGASAGFDTASPASSRQNPSMTSCGSRPTALQYARR